MLESLGKRFIRILDWAILTAVWECSSDAAHSLQTCFSLSRSLHVHCPGDNLEHRGDRVGRLQSMQRDLAHAKSSARCQVFFQASKTTGAFPQKLLHSPTQLDEAIQSRRKASSTCRFYKCECQTERAFDWPKSRIRNSLDATIFLCSSYCTVMMPDCLTCIRL